MLLKMVLSQTPPISYTLILVQDPAHKINYTHSAMAACDLFMGSCAYICLKASMPVYSSYMRGVATQIQGDGRVGLEGCRMSICWYDLPHVDDKAAATYSVYSAGPRCLFLLHLLSAATAMTWVLVELPPPFSALVGRQQRQTRNCTFLAVECVNLKLLAMWRVSGVSQWSTETPSGQRTKRLDRLELPVRQAGGGCPLSAAMSDWTSLLSDVRNDVGTLGLRYQYILILYPILARMSSTISVYPDIVFDIRSYIRYNIWDVPDIVGGKNQVNLNIGPDIGVLTPISEVKTR